MSSKNWHFFFLLTGVFLYIIYFTYLSFLRHDNFYTGRYDLGNMTQVVWNTSQGRIFEMSSDDFNGIPSISRLQVHADGILMLFAPLYWLWDSPKVLLLIQSLVLGMGAVFVYKISQKMLKNDFISLIFGLCYLLNPAVEYTNLYDFHPVALATTFLLGAWYFLIGKRIWLFILFALLSASTKEQVWAIIGMLGIIGIGMHSKPWLSKGNFQALVKKTTENKLLLILSVVSFMMFYLLLWYWIPSARGANHFALEYYSDFGSSPSSVIKTIVLDPFKTIQTMFQPNQQSYMRQLFLPLGYMSLFSPLILFFALPDLLINLLSSNKNLHQIYYQYSATITPFLFISAIYGVVVFRKVFPKIPLFLIGFYLGFTTLYASYAFGPLPYAKKPNLDMIKKPYQNKEIVQKYLSQIPKESIVSASNNIGAHLSHRKEIYTIPIATERADFLAFLLNDAFAQPSPQAQKDMVKELKKNNKYRVVFEKDDFILFEKIL